ncbi:MAG: hypothetical protein IJP82_09500 [Bacteroidaceae bacterium]|nr:hypothetical protein [Bacteroidaceae bacterium]
MYKIQTNASGTRYIEVTEEHLKTIEEYSLFKGLVPSNGIVDETTLETLKHNVKSIILNDAVEDNKDLCNLCFNVLYHDNMKVFGLKELIMLYIGWHDNK